ncbi:MAG TPA: hypothetical protein VK576_09310, partial [Thermoleophilia bacterium]|nr:hypothetical protein [Thermoleophilia bacterium]
MPADPEAEVAPAPATAAADVVAHLRELGLATALIGAPETAVPISAVATDADAAPGDLAWSKRAGSAARFAGSLLICSPEAAGELRSPAASGTVIVVCARPRLAMAHTISRFFMH